MQSHARFFVIWPSELSLPATSRGLGTLEILTPVACTRSLESVEHTGSINLGLLDLMVDDRFVNVK